MIGKKSKFGEHEQSKIQDKDKASDRDRGKEEKINSSTEDDGNIKENKKGDSKYREYFVQEINKSNKREIFEEEIEEIPEEAQQFAKNNDFSRSNENLKLQRLPTILIPKNLKSDTQLLWDEICNGVKGKNSGIPMGFNRLNKYLGLRRSIYTLIGAGTGVGKTALVDCAYVLNPYDWYIKNKHSSNIKFECVYFSMERKKTYKLAKWLCMKIWKEEGVLMTVDELLSWGKTLDKRKQEVANFYLPYFDEMIQSGVVKIIDGAINPTGVYVALKDNAEKKGKIIEVSEFEKRYIPNDDNLITNVVLDHIGCLKKEAISGSYDKKANIDKLSEYCRIVRDLYHYSPIAISQFNRTSYQDIQQARKDGIDPEPTLEYFKDSSNTAEDADVILTLFNPLRYNLNDYMKYDIDKFVDSQNGNFHFRSIKLLKNSYGTSDVRIGMGFLGEIGLFKELPKSEDITEGDYRSIINKNFFK